MYFNSKNKLTFERPTRRLTLQVSMRWEFLHKSKQWMKSSLPLTWYGLLFFCLIGLAAMSLRIIEKDQNESFIAILKVCKTIAMYAIGCILLFALLTTFIPWWLIRKNSKNIRVHLIQQNAFKKDLFEVQLEIEPKLRAHALCLLKCQFIGGNYLSKLVELEESSHFQMSQKKTYYRAVIQLQDVKDYAIDYIQLYIGDFLHLFSFSQKIPAHFLLQNLPEKTKVPEVKVLPRKADMSDRRAETSQMAQGDLYQFKQFEDNDDIRRIVWSIYARSGELVVRTPEIKSEFASDVLLYCSFYSGFKTSSSTVLDSLYLNIYKNAIWSFYLSWAEKEKDGKVLALVDDNKQELSSKEEIEKALMHAHWHEQPVFLQGKEWEKVSVILVSSLIPIGEVESMMQQLPDAVQIIQIKISEMIDQLPSKIWMPTVFLETEKIPEFQNKWQWQMNTSRKALVENETAIAQLLSNRITKISL
ncbi:DUF58 domain-containing protein [Rhizosphaericola mali]|uniref:DUF58 domain-containing protein n=1 Tax=Rhizosphaericola mali TaxID=2545455 RepID=UPI001CDA0C3D|nr:DUF58 domain-containing protein [Rhizosphaericola mali]